MPHSYLVLDHARCSYLEGDPGVGREDVVVELHLLRHVSHLHRNRYVEVMLYAVRKDSSMHALCQVMRMRNTFKSAYHLRNNYYGYNHNNA